MEKSPIILIKGKESNYSLSIGQKYIRFSINNGYQTIYKNSGDYGLLFETQAGDVNKNSL